MEITQYMDSFFVAIVTFLLLIFVEDMLGINRTGKIIIALIFAIIHHNYGHLIVPWIASILQILGFNSSEPKL